MPNTGIAQLVVFDAERCCGTILPSDGQSFTICFDGIDGEQARYQACNGKLRVTLSKNPILSWEAVARDLAVGVRVLPRNHLYVEDGLVERYNIRLEQYKYSIDN